jgi:GDP-L-fucose synthase
MTLEDKKVLVTGASGLIGSNLFIKLKETGSKVRVVVHNNLSDPIKHNPIINGDLTKKDFCDYITKDIDILFHCAADSSGAATQSKDPLSMTINNTVMNSYLLQSAYKNKVQKVVWLASTTGYPNSEEEMTEDMMFQGDPFDKYFAVGWMKRYTEKLCQLFSEKLERKMPCIVLRPTNIYGPYDKIDPQRSHVLTALIRKVVEKQNPIEIWGDGKDIRDVLYVDDMIDAMILSAKKIETFEQINIGYGKSYTVIELLKMIKKIGNWDAPHCLVPGPQMIPVRRVNIEKAKNILGWKPRVDVNDGIARTFHWVNQKLSKKCGETKIYD